MDLSFMQLLGIFISIVAYGVVMIGLGCVVWKKHALSADVRVRALNERYIGAAVVVISPMLFIMAVLVNLSGLRDGGFYAWSLWWHDVMWLPFFVLIPLGFRYRIRRREVIQQPPHHDK